MHPVFRRDLADRFFFFQDNKIVCDMSEVKSMASAGLRVLTSVQKTCKRYNRGKIVLTNVPKRVCESFELSGFAPLFKFFEDPLLAVGHF
jgi:anti-anti-sigma factor